MFGNTASLRRFCGLIRRKVMGFYRFGAIVCKTIRPLSVLSCLSVCLSVALMYCGQTVAWMNMKLGTEVGLDSGHIVLGGDPPPPQKGHSPQISARLLSPNG